MKETINEVILSLNAISNAANMLEVRGEDNYKTILAITATLADNVKKLLSVTEEMEKGAEEEA